MKTFYTSERNAQILIALLKAYGIRKVIASPGSTNICFVASLQQDPYFEIYSAVDERSAAFIACGLADESGEPVVLSCTGATASRNYMPGITEAYNRKQPVLVVTSSQRNSRIGHNIPQVTDRQKPEPYLVKLSVQMPVIHDSEDEWDCMVKCNQALQELKREGGGTVHINLFTQYSQDYSVRKLPPVRMIQRYTERDALPEISGGGVAIFVGAHLRWSDRLTEAVDRFCECYNAAVLCDHTSNYKGKYGVMANLVAIQRRGRAACVSPDIMIHIGEVSGAYMRLSPKRVWRVNPDGESRDTFKKLTKVFEMEEESFFERYIAQSGETARQTSYYDEWMREYNNIFARIPDIPFSAAWIAQKTAPVLPEESVLHLGILNSLRTWNYFCTPKSVEGYSNVGGFGIDGSMSSLIGASLMNPDKLYYIVLGDLAFFYDMNALRNCIGRNVRILLVNNGLGFEMKYYKCAAPVQKYFGESANAFFAAKGHNGSMSRDLVKHYAEDLGITYLSATNKDEYLQALETFVQPRTNDAPMLLEAFTDENLENEAQIIIDNISVEPAENIRHLAKEILGPQKTEKIMWLKNKKYV